MTERLITPSTNTARSSVVVSAAQMAASLIGGLFAILVVVILGEGDEADGFLAAYSAYLLLILLGSTMRVSLIPLFGRPSEGDVFVANAKLRVGQIVPIAFVVSLVFVLAAPLLGWALMNGASDKAQDAATLSIVLLGVAAFGQIWAAVLSAVLGAVQRFVASALVFLCASVLMVVLAGSLMELLGVVGAGIGVAIAAGFLVVAHLIVLGRLDFTAWPMPRTIFERASWVSTGRASSVSIMTMVLQLNLTIAIGFVSGATGLVSGYVFAYLATIMATGVTASTIGLVTLPGLMETLEKHGEGEAKVYLREAAAFGAFLYTPLAVGFVCFGWPVTEAVLGGALEPATLRFFWDAARVFLAMGMIWTIFAPLVTIALAQQKYAKVAAASLLIIPLHVLLVAIGSTEGAFGVVVGHAVAGALLYVVFAAMLLGREAPGAAWATVKSVAPCALLALIFVVPGVLLGPDISVGLATAALIVCLAAYVALGIRFWPRIAGRMFELLLGRDSRQPEPTA